MNCESIFDRSDTSTSPREKQRRDAKETIYFFFDEKLGFYHLLKSIEIQF